MMKRTILLVVLAVLVALIDTENHKAPVITNNKHITIEDFYSEKRNKRLAGHAKMDAPEMHALIQRELRTPADREFPEYSDNQVYREYQKARSRSTSARVASDLTFIERGPGNIAGRTRALIVDPDDPTSNTWFAGSASGGIWKTTDGGKTWENMSDDFPNLGTNTLAISPANTNVIYAGTGEHFTNDIDGAGLFKSVDKGETWFQIANPEVYPDMRNISRIIVDPGDENTVILTSRNSLWVGGSQTAIYKTTDGGLSWDRKYEASGKRLDDLDHDPSDFNIQYAASLGSGVLKSTDAGETWLNSSTGLRPGGRVEIAISPVDPDRLWASVEGFETGTGSDLYVSLNGGEVWNLMSEINSGPNVNFLGGQGWYDNIITAHPFDQDIVYVGGVNLWQFELKEGSVELASVEVNENGSGTFMDLVNFGATHYGGKLEVDENADSLVSVEVRFGQGSQLAHRFTVDKRGSGVPDEDYEYADYVEVPFQVWDVSNDRQLMVSFRDQQEDGNWNLIEQETDQGTDPSIHSREYLFVHFRAYADTADAAIARTGGQATDRLYFIWPVLQEGSQFDPDNLPQSSLDISRFIAETRFRETTNLSDAYEEFDEQNTFTATQTINQEGLHPDQHNIIPIIEDEESQTFRLLVANDGGVYVSKVSTAPGISDDDFEYAGFGFNTTQFYGADKAPGEDRYIGGMQDNSTWFVPFGEEGNPTTAYQFAFGGDGFEAIWNNRNIDEMIGSIQFNQLLRTSDGGETWFGATSALQDVGSGNAPFISRLANSKLRPERIYTIGRTGVWSSFKAERWEVTPLQSDYWVFRNSMDVEVSDADTDIIWAGGGLSESERLYVSTDGARTFSPVNNYSGTTLGVCSGFKPDPVDPNTAYALFSFAGRPKVLKTMDLGQSWEDISGFEGNASSSRGFPDVAINSILVFPNDNERLWVGSEIGIIESLDGGQSWNFLECDLPPVNVYDFKIQDDQVVIATYGRGIWTVTMPEVERDIIFAPSIDKVVITPTGETRFQITYDEIFDSTVVYVGDEVVLSVDNNEVGATTYITDNLGKNEVLNSRVFSYLSGQVFKSEERNTIYFDPDDPSTSFQTDFNKINDFVIDGMKFFKGNGFSTASLHSEHPYGEASNFMTVLRTPIIISHDEATMSYKDVAIIETGEDGTVFGDEEFYDYVVVEGSKDGEEWIPLAPGYDASFNEHWKTAYIGENAGNESMYVEHTVSLTDSFAVGDTILIRFRLFSDPFTVGWGWAIDDVKIQNQVLSVENRFEGTFNIYPNPITSTSTVNYSLRSSGKLTLLSIDGKVLRRYKLTRGTGSVEIHNAGLKRGVYLLRLESQEGAVTKKIVTN